MAGQVNAFSWFVLRGQLQGIALLRLPFLHEFQQPLEMLRAVDLTPRIIPVHHIFEDIFDCVRWLEEEFVSGRSTLEPRML